MEKRLTIIVLLFISLTAFAGSIAPGVSKSSGISEKCYALNPQPGLEISGRTLNISSLGSIKLPFTIVYQNYDVSRFTTEIITSDERLSLEIPDDAIAARIIKSIQAKESDDGIYHYMTTGDAASICLPQIKDAQVNVILKNVKEIPESEEERQKHLKAFNYRSFVIDFNIQN